jgi:hypothetical protein
MLTQSAVLRDDGGDVLQGEVGGVLSDVRSVIEFARELMQFDFQQCTMRQTEMFMALAIQLCMERMAQFPRIGRSGEVNFAVRDSGVTDDHADVFQDSSVGSLSPATVSSSGAGGGGMKFASGLTRFVGSGKTRS